jgi:hypothetical protein
MLEGAEASNATDACGPSVRFEHGTPKPKGGSSLPQLAQIAVVHYALARPDRGRVVCGASF